MDTFSCRCINGILKTTIVLNLCELEIIIKLNVFLKLLKLVSSQAVNVFHPLSLASHDGTDTYIAGRRAIRCQPNDSTEPRYCVWSKPSVVQE